VFPAARRPALAAALGLVALILVHAAAPPTARAQEPAILTLEDAIALAQRNNPDYQARRNDARAADWALREAYGQLLPGAGISSTVQYQAEGTPRFGTFTGGDLGLGKTPAYYLSNYNLGLSYRLSGAQVYRVGQERAAHRATAAGIEAAGALLVADVTRQYLGAVRARDAVELARQELARAEENVKMAEARVAVGAAIPLEAKQAAVERGRAEVETLRADNLLSTETLRLMELLGVELERDVRLVSEFDVTRPTWRQDELLALAYRAHPGLGALRASADAGDASVRMARSAYLPTLQFNAGWSGYTRQVGSDGFLLGQAEDQLRGRYEQCVLLNQISAGLTSPIPGTPTDCAPYRSLSAEQRSQILAGNQAFPFDFTREPLVAQLQLSFPIFQGFTRQRQVETARVAAEDTRHRLRAQELRVRTEVTTALRTLQTAHRAVELEEVNRALAGEQLGLARERYRVGATNFLELLDAETMKARADRSYLVARYTYLESLAALEAAVGGSLPMP
jgi:outer membrane protein